MNEYTPDRWSLVKMFDTNNNEYIYKVFGTWAGGYLGSDSWRMNSGIERAESDSEAFYFYGYSGSRYKCYRGSEGVIGAYNYGVANSIEEHGGEFISLEDFVKEFDVKDVSDD